MHSRKLFSIENHSVTEALELLLARLQALQEEVEREAARTEQRLDALEERVRAL